MTSSAELPSRLDIIPASKEPAGLCTRDGKRPAGLSLIPWQNGKPLAWDVTVGATLAESYVEVS